MGTQTRKMFSSYLKMGTPLKKVGTIDWSKARLTARGFSQNYRFDYEERFSPVAKMVTVIFQHA